jgi:Zn-finger nucleic acid-binding protein
MPVMRICPKCQGDTELRGAMDVWYLTWCPECERLWRLELWSLLNNDEPERKHPSAARKPVY